MRHLLQLVLVLSLPMVTVSSKASPAKPVMGFDTYYSGWNGTEDLSRFGRTNVYCGPSERFILIMATNYLKDGLQDLGYDWM